MYAELPPPVIPPLRFNMVEEGLYRGAYPTLRSLRFLRRLKLRTILSLIPEEPTSDLSEFCSKEHIQLRYIHCDKFKGDKVTLSPQDVMSVLDAMVNPEIHPLYVHCLDGRNVVGVCCMQLRRVQGWAPEAYKREHLRWTRDIDACGMEAGFLLEMPITVLSLPVKTPLWLWEGNVSDADEMRVKKLVLNLKIRLPLRSVPNQEPPQTESGRKAKEEGNVSNVECSYDSLASGLFSWPAGNVVNVSDELLSFGITLWSHKFRGCMTLRRHAPDVPTTQVSETDFGNEFFA